MVNEEDSTAQGRKEKVGREGKGQSSGRALKWDMNYDKLGVCCDLGEEGNDNKSTILLERERETQKQKQVSYVIFMVRK